MLASWLPLFAARQHLPWRGKHLRQPTSACPASCPQTRWTSGICVARRARTGGGPSLRRGTWGWRVEEHRRWPGAESRVHLSMELRAGVWPVAERCVHGNIVIMRTTTTKTRSSTTREENPAASTSCRIRRVFSCRDQRQQGRNSMTYQALGWRASVGIGVTHAVISGVGCRPTTR